MASICKRNGSGKWLIRFKDENNKWKTVAGFTDKALTKKRAELLEFEAERVRRGGVNPIAQTAPLAEHVAAYERHLANRSEDYINTTISRINSFKFSSVAQLFDADATDRVQKVLKTLSVASANHYLTAIRGFCRWLNRLRKLPTSPILGMKKIPRADDGRKRRAATEDEIQKLLAGLKGTVGGFTADQRHYLYLTALETGFRAKELASLRPDDFGKASIHLRGSNAKNGKAVDQPISTQFAKIIADCQGWPGRWYRRAAEMLTHDLKAAGVSFETAAGVLDFHSFRVTYITNLAKAGVHPKIAQTLARHSTIELTMKFYTRFGSDDVAKVAQQMRSIFTVRYSPAASASDRNGKHLTNGSH